MAAELLTVTQYSLQTSLNSDCRSTSCWYSLPSADVADWPTMATTGWWSIFASYRPLSRWIAPGPLVARQTATSPVNLAWATAMKAAISSWRHWMNLGLSPALRRATVMPVMPSPGRP